MTMLTGAIENHCDELKVMLETADEEELETVRPLFEELAKFLAGPEEAEPSQESCLECGEDITAGDEGPYCSLCRTMKYGS